jgi:hypothetical protein
VLVWQVFQGDRLSQCPFLENYLTLKMNRNRSKNNSYLRKSFHFKKFFFVFASQAPFFKLKISNVRTHFSVKWFPRWDSQRFSSDGSCYREKWYPKSSPFFVQFDGGPISFSISAWNKNSNGFRYAIGNWLGVADLLLSSTVKSQ